jgi:hypothetical protein
MKPQDVFNQAFDRATAELDAWLPSLADDAVIDRERMPMYWRARLIPHQANACPVEVMLSRSQVFDIEAGTESAEGQPLQDFGLFLPLLQAVVDGHVIQRTWLSQATGSELNREWIVEIAPGQTWSMRRHVRAGTAATELSAVATDHAFVPYRRG